jgi:BirA family biotin operon repressor/biotin-[acetyl-CoA-carboxylase] ligase
VSAPVSVQSRADGHDGTRSGAGQSPAGEAPAPLPAGGVRALGFPAGARNRLAAALIDALGETLDRYDAAGFEAFRSRWLALDAFAGCPVSARWEGECLDGTAAGVDAEGALLLEAGGRTLRFLSAEVSLRPLP